MGSLTALLLRALFDTALTMNNVVVKLLAPAAAATLTCKSMRVATSPDAWREALGVLPRPPPPGTPCASRRVARVVLRGTWRSAHSAACCCASCGLRRSAGLQSVS